MKVRTVLFSLLGLAALALVAACAVDPVTGRNEFLLVSEDQEIMMGKSGAKSVIKEYGKFEDERLNAYVGELGLRLAKMSHRPNLPWRVEIMNDSIVNAFAYPGGVVYVTRGMLPMLNDEAQLAALLGHEIGHVTARHTAEAISRAQAAGLFVTAAQIAVGPYGSALGVALDPALRVLFASYSRENEHEADSLGVQYAARAGYDADRYSHFFPQMQRYQAIKTQGRRSTLPGWFDTHPTDIDRQGRTARLASEIMSAQPGREWTVARGRYLMKVDNMIYGDDPSEGFRDESICYLPALGAQFEIPAGWSLHDAKTLLIMQSPDKQSRVLVRLAENMKPQDAASEMAYRMGWKVHDTMRTKVNGRSAVILLSDVPQGLISANRILTYAIQAGSNTLIFNGLTEHRNFDALREELAEPAKSLRDIDPDKANPRPMRVRVVTVAGAKPMRKVLEEHKVKKALWEEVASLNAIPLDHVVEDGALVKVVQ